MNKNSKSNKLLLIIATLILLLFIGSPLFVYLEIANDQDQMIELIDNGNLINLTLDGTDKKYIIPLDDLLKIKHPEIINNFKAQSYSLDLVEHNIIDDVDYPNLFFTGLITENGNKILNSKNKNKRTKRLQAKVKDINDILVKIDSKLKSISPERKKRIKKLKARKRKQSKTFDKLLRKLSKNSDSFGFLGLTVSNLLVAYPEDYNLDDVKNNDNDFITLGEIQSDLNLYAILNESIALKDLAEISFKEFPFEVKILDKNLEISRKGSSQSQESFFVAIKSHDAILALVLLDFEVADEAIEGEDEIENPLTSSNTSSKNNTKGNPSSVKSIKTESLDQVLDPRLTPRASPSPGNNNCECVEDVSCVTNTIEYDSALTQFKSESICVATSTRKVKCPASSSLSCQDRQKNAKQCTFINKSTAKKVGKQIFLDATNPNLFECKLS